MRMALQYGMLMQLSIMLLSLLVPAATSVVATTRARAIQGGEEDETAIALPGCKAKCGNIEIPYPFGIGDRCYFGPQFEITCNDGSTEPRLMKTRMLVDSISLEEGELQTRQLVNRDCYDAQGKPTGQHQSQGGLSLRPPYTISGDKNRMFVVGCDTYAELVGIRDHRSYTTGCISKCNNNPGDYAKNNICSGMGCCRTKIPPLLSNLTLKVASYKNHTGVHHFNPCGYAFVAKMDQFKFSKKSFQELNKTQRLSLVLDWQIGDESCENARKNKMTFACKGNSDCHNKTSSGYICRCKDGYQGNPYLEDGCRDIDACALNSTLCKHGKCKNKEGNYSCVCNSGYKNRDDITCIKVPSTQTGTPKNKKVPSTKPLKISLGTSLSFFVLLVGFLLKYLDMTNKKFIKLERKYWEFANGGEHFTKKLARIRGSDGKRATRTFTEEEVKQATKEKVGEGGYGIVYKGILDTQAVAIKKSKFSPPVTAIEPFVNEMINLSQINHKNVVRLVGCCFETRTPILVYEFIARGTLYDHIHRRNKKGLSLLPLALRLKIAAEAADALAYLHDSISPPIIHGDVKTTNILLDENYMAKVSDFGASRLVPEDENQISTLVKETQGYLDPQYLQSNTFTEKSDVYSFGVVLAELLTSRKAVCLEKPEEERNLANVFVSKVESSLLDEILDREIVEGHLKGFSEKTADLAIRCLRVKREERPPMKEVAEELHGLVRTMEPHPSGWEANIPPSPKDTGNLFGSSASSASLVDNTGVGDDGDGADSCISKSRLLAMGENCFTCSW